MLLLRRINQLRKVLFLGRVIIVALLEFNVFLSLPYPFKLFLQINLFLARIHHLESISNQVFFDNVVQRSVSRKAWRMVDLQKIAPILVVYHKIKAKQLKAHIEVRLLWAADLIVCNQHRLSRNQSFNDLILYLTPERIGFIAHFL
jgi:hypothetical protein